MQNNKQKKFVRWVAGLVSVGGILYGYDMGVISGALLFIKNTIPMTDAQVGLIVGAVLGGGLFGTLLAGPVGDHYGRRFLIASAAIIFMLGVSLVLVAHSFSMIFSARLLLGVGVGMVSVAVPLYVSEIVPSKDRGKYITFFQLLLTFGILLAYFVDLIFTPSENWRAMFAVLFIPATILLIGILRLPESPRWLIANHQPEKARHVLQQTHYRTADIDKEIQMMASSLAMPRGTWKEFFSHQAWGACLLAVFIAIFNQLTGINSFLQYAPLILKQAGMSSNLITMLGSVGIGLLNFIFTLLAITLIDTLGRRPLLLIGVLGVVISEIYLGAVNYFMPVSMLSGILSLVGLLFFILFFAIGPGVVIWLAISELFPTRVRAKGIALCLFFNSLAATGLSAFFLPLTSFFGMGCMYWMFALFGTLYFLLVLFFLPETKARSLEEIQLDFQNKRTSKRVIA
jgi:sugar porter (SP) family MFS transporter